MMMTITMSAQLLFLKVSLVFFISIGNFFNLSLFYISFLVASVSPAEKRLKKAEDERDEAKLKLQTAERKLEAAELERTVLKKKRETNDTSFDKAELEKVEEEIKRLSAIVEKANDWYHECVRAVEKCKKKQHFWLFFFCDF
jgi:peptidoglycan hydrolase CwlO-like protein